MRRILLQAASEAKNALLQRIKQLQSDIDHNIAETERFNRLRAEADSQADAHPQAIDGLERSSEQLAKADEEPSQAQASVDCEEAKPQTKARLQSSEVLLQAAVQAIQQQSQKAEHSAFTVGICLLLGFPKFVGIYECLYHIWPPTIEFCQS